MRRFSGLSVVAIIVALLGADAAGAFVGPVSTKRVEKFVKGQAKIATANQQPVFPNARIADKKWLNKFVGCVQDYAHPRRWQCIYHVPFYEMETTAPPPGEIQQRALRYCEDPGYRLSPNQRFKKAVQVRRGAGQKLRVVGGWPMTCRLTQSVINDWNLYGDDYDPARSEPVAYEQVPAIPEIAKQKMPGDLPPLPSGAPGGPPPGPLSVTGGSASRSAPSALKRKRGLCPSGCAQNETFTGCSSWGQWHLNYGSNAWTYSCFWQVHSYPGFAIGYGNNVQRYEQYYYLGYYEYGRPAARLWATGTF